MKSFSLVMVLTAKMLIQRWWGNVSSKNSNPSHDLNAPFELEVLCVQIGNNDSVNFCLF